MAPALIKPCHIWSPRKKHINSLSASSKQEANVYMKSKIVAQMNEN
jgi:hypothetical protein